MTHRKLAQQYATLLLATATALSACTDGGKKTETERLLAEREKELAELRQLAELDRREMENQYADFAHQYDEMKRGVKDDSLVARLNREQQRAERLLGEIRRLKNEKSADAAEIIRLKKELETVRALLRDYVRQVDSLQQRNIALTTERDAARADAERTRQENTGLAERNQQLNEKVEIAAQLNATGIVLTPLKKNSKPASKSKDIKSFSLAFTITRNVTAKTGNKIVYVRLLKPNQSVLGAAGSFRYENRTLECSAQKTIEYTGQEQRVQLYIPSAEFLGGGKYTAHIFCDGQLIGTGSVTMEK